MINDEDLPPPATPSQQGDVRFPPDVDQYEHPYTYEHDLPDDAETEEEKEQVRENWGL